MPSMVSKENFLMLNTYMFEALVPTMPPIYARAAAQLDWVFCNKVTTPLYGCWGWRAGFVCW